MTINVNGTDIHVWPEEAAAIKDEIEIGPDDIPEEPGCSKDDCDRCMKCIDNDDASASEDF